MTGGFLLYKKGRIAMGAKVYLKSGDIIEYKNVMSVNRHKDGTIAIEYRDKGENKLAVFFLGNIVGYEW